MGTAPESVRVVADGEGVDLRGVDLVEVLLDQSLQTGKIVGLVGRDPPPAVLDDVGALANGACGEHAASMNRRMAHHVRGLGTRRR